MSVVADARELVPALASIIPEGRVFYQAPRLARRVPILTFSFLRPEGS